MSPDCDRHTSFCHRFSCFISKFCRQKDTFHRFIIVHSREPGAGGGERDDGSHRNAEGGAAQCFLHLLGNQKLKSVVNYSLETKGETEQEENFTEYLVSAENSGERLDKALAALMPKVSRSRLQTWIKQGAVTVNGKPVDKVRDPVYEGDVVAVTAQPSPEELAFTPADVPFDVAYEDDAIIVVNKPSGLVVHPAAGHWDDTLLNGLLFRYPELRVLPRAGIVHRLDRDTTGLMVVAKTLEAETSLVRHLL